MISFFPKFVNYEDIPKGSITIDVRTNQEYLKNDILDYNVPIMNKKQHTTMKWFILFSLPIIVYRIYKNRHYINKSVFDIISENKKGSIVIGCSRGRLRSPLAAMYVSYKFGVKTYVIKGGVKNLKKGECGK